MNFSISPEDLLELSFKPVTDGIVKDRVATADAAEEKSRSEAGAEGELAAEEPEVIRATAIVFFFDLEAFLFHLDFSHFV